MLENIKNQVVKQIKQSLIFVLQLDESIDVSSCAQLMIYVRYIHSSNFKEVRIVDITYMYHQFLSCQPLESDTRGIDVFSKVGTFLYKMVSIVKRLGHYAQMRSFYVSNSLWVPDTR